MGVGSFCRVRWAVSIFLKWCHQNLFWDAPPPWIRVTTRVMIPLGLQIPINLHLPLASWEAEHPKSYACLFLQILYVDKSAPAPMNKATPALTWMSAKHFILGNLFVKSQDWDFLAGGWQAVSKTLSLPKVFQFTLTPCTPKTVTSSPVRIPLPIHRTDAFFGYVWNITCEELGLVMFDTPIFQRRAGQTHLTSLKKIVWRDTHQIGLADLIGWLVGW